MKLFKGEREMKVERRILVAVMAVAVAGLMLVGTGSASAAVWKMGGSNVSTFFELPMSGAENFETNGEGGMNCEIVVTMTSSGGSAAKVTKWETKSCKGFGTMAACTLNSSEPKTLPWTVAVNATNLTTAAHRVRRTVKNCGAITEFDKTINPMTFTPDSLSAIKSFEFLGTNGTYKAYGSLTIEGAASGTYAIG